MSKPHLTGLIDRKAFPQPGFESVLDGFVCIVNWSELQPTNGGALVTTTIDAAKAQAAAYPNLRIKIRVFCGIAAPTWAKQLAGFTPFGLMTSNGFSMTIGGLPVGGVQPKIWDAVTTYGLDKIVFSQTTGKFHRSLSAGNLNHAVTDGAWWTSGSTTTNGGLIGPFWRADWMTAVTDMQTKLAAIYDNDPQIAEIVVSGASTVFAEPLVRHTDGTSDIDVSQANLLLANGFTIDLDHIAEMGAIDATSAWVNTNASLACSPYDVTIAGGNGGHDDYFTASVMAHLIDVFGDRGIPGNNSVDSGTGLNQPLYMGLGAMQMCYIQTRVASAIGSLPGAINKCFQLGALYVELPLDSNSPSGQSYDQFAPSVVNSWRLPFKNRTLTRSRQPSIPPPFIHNFTY